MIQNIKTVVFDLDGTIYQNLEFYKDYLHFLTQDTKYSDWEGELVQFTRRVFDGEILEMNRFYRVAPLAPRTAGELFTKLGEQLCETLAYSQALERQDIIYLGDAWALVTFIGKSLGLLEGGRADSVYRRTRTQMERDRMSGNERLKQAISKLCERRRVLLMSNSYEQTAQEFLHQLGYDGLFPHLFCSANKPHGMIARLEEFDPNLFRAPETVLAIGDHAYNDLMPIAQCGGRTAWMNPFERVSHHECDIELATLEELADFLNTI